MLGSVGRTPTATCCRAASPAVARTAMLTTPPTSRPLAGACVNVMEGLRDGAAPMAAPRPGATIVLHKTKKENAKSIVLLHNEMRMFLRNITLELASEL